MSAPIVKGWCPGGLRPMLSGDGLLVRVKPLIGRLTQTQAAGVAYLAEQCGNGLIDLSARATLTIRGVTDQTYDRLITGLKELNLIDPTPEAEARRNCIVTPYWENGDGTAELAERLTKALQEQEDLRLPGKFGFSIDTGSFPVLRAVSADIRIERDTNGMLLCRPDGADTGAHVTPDSLVQTAISLAEWFVTTGGRTRMAAHLADGAVLPSAFTVMKVASYRKIPQPVPHVSSAGVLVGFAFGQLQAVTLGALATHSPLRLTPWRMLLLEGQTQAPALNDIITSQNDPLLRVAACTGAPGCSQALLPTRHLAHALAPYVLQGQSLHISGCSKGCAHPNAASVTLVAQESGFALVRNGNACAASYERTFSPAMLLEDPDALFL